MTFGNVCLGDIPTSTAADGLGDGVLGPAARLNFPKKETYPPWNALHD